MRLHYAYHFYIDPNSYGSKIGGRFMSTIKITFSKLRLLNEISLKTGHSYFLSPKSVSISLIEMEDVLFRTNSVVFMPNGPDGSSENKTPQDDTATPQQEVITGLDVIKTILIRLQEYPEQKILITGHADTSGQDVPNQKLGYGRATSVQYILEGKGPDWATIAENQHHKKDVQHLLEWAHTTKGYDTDPLGVDGNIGSDTKDALEKFYPAINAEFGKSFTAVRAVTNEFWEGVFLLYEDALQTLLATDAAGLAHIRKSVRWMDDTHKSVGCGEYWPIDQAHKDRYRSEANRRVETYFFDKDEKLTFTCDPLNYPCQKDSCPLFPHSKIPRNFLPVHPSPHAQSTPTFTAPEKPGSATKVNMQNVIAYIAVFDKTNGNRKSLQRFELHNGKLCNLGTTTPVKVNCNIEAWFYFSHRSDLSSGSLANEFKMDNTGFPLIGPIFIPCGTAAKLHIDIWQQNDWVVLENVEVDGKRANQVLMADWNNNYSIGTRGTTTTGEQVFLKITNYTYKDPQEVWNTSYAPIPLVEFSKVGGNPLLIATLTKLPKSKAKLLLVYDKAGLKVFTTSFNEIAPSGSNQLLKSHHTYNKDLVSKLEGVDAEVSQDGIIDAFPNPPSRFILPGDMCIQNQGGTNFCGAYSFSTAMNYWFPFTYNPLEKDGKYCSNPNVVPALFNGARTPDHIVEAASKHNMNGVDRNGENLSKAQAIKLIKLWIQAGVPVLFLVNEEPHSGLFDNIANSHWKTLVGWDGDRIFMNNSGGDLEVYVSRRDPPGLDYEHAPVGNDVDSESAFYKKWEEVSNLADMFSSVDECTFIPLYPKNAMFGASQAQ